jgi:Co/Zn/Cd efflux system component
MSDKVELLKSNEGKFQLTNHQVLVMTAILFGLFVAAEFVGAIVSNSLSLLGDAAAMSVDVLTVSCSFIILFLLLSSFSNIPFLPVFRKSLCRESEVSTWNNR